MRKKSKINKIRELISGMHSRQPRILVIVTESTGDNFLMGEGGTKGREVKEVLPCDTLINFVHKNAPKSYPANVRPGDILINVIEN